MRIRYAKKLLMVIFMNALKTKRKKLSVSLMVLAAILQLEPFTRVFHQVPDDNFFQYVAFSENFNYMWRVSHLAAYGQGRIGQYPAMFLNYFSNYFIDSWLFRIFVIIIFAAFYVLLFLYLDLLLGSKFSKIAIPLAIASVPLAKFHFPPNSYPLVVTLPLLSILLLRYFTYSLKWENKKQRPKIIILRLALFFPMMFYEYPIIFGFLLTVIEASIRLWFKKSSPKSKNRVIIKNIISKPWQFLTIPEIYLDIFVLSLVVGSYIIFRLHFPSQYEGNSFSSMNWKNTLYVQFFHAIGGMSPAHWDLQGQENVLVWIKATIIGFCVSYVVWFNWIKARFFAPSLLIFLGVGWAFFTTLPFGLSAKYQEWCLEAGDCYYIDSRLAFPGICLIIIGMAYFIDKINPTFLGRNSIRAIFTFLVFVLAVVTSVSNNHTYYKMAEYQQPFDMMQSYSCLFPDEREFDPQLLELLQYLPQVAWHEELTETKLDYLKLYLNHSRQEICQ